MRLVKGGQAVSVTVQVFGTTKARRHVGGKPSAKDPPKGVEGKPERAEQMERARPRVPLARVAMERDI